MEYPDSHLIEQFVHCRACIQEQDPGTLSLESIRDYQRLEVGFTPHGLQIFCLRHQQSVMLIDFEGLQHPIG